MTDDLEGKRFTIYGPPGTGKTDYLAKQTLRLCRKIRNLGISGAEPPSRPPIHPPIMICSLTKTAATEIRNRVKREVPEADGLVSVGTLHSHCWHALGRPRIVEVLLRSEPTAIREFLAGKAIRDCLGGQLTADSGELFFTDMREMHASVDEELVAEISRLRQRLTPSELWPLRLQGYWASYQAFKNAGEISDFTDLLERCLDGLPHPGRPVAVFCDEAQDCSAMELALLKQWARYADYAMISGDDDQALYDWRGASVDAFLEWSEWSHVLGQSYRLPRRVQSYATHWVVQNVVNRREKDFRPRDAEGEVEVGYPLRYRHPAAVATVAEQLASTGTVMILTTTNRMLAGICRELKDRGIPFHNPYRPAAGQWNPIPIKAKKGTITSAARVLSYLQVAAEQKPWTYASLQAWVDAVRVSSVRRRLTEEEEGRESEVVSPEALVDILGRDAVAPAILGNLDWLEERLLGRNQEMKYPIRVARKNGWRGLADSPRIVVGTVHSVKGGEADHVLLFPDLGPNFGEMWRGSREQRDSIGRIMYVGMTRAKQSLRLCEASEPHAVRWPGVEHAGVEPW